MITAVFSKSGNKYTGFSVKGHSGYASAGQDIVCSAVSSAVMLTANTLTDFLNSEAKVEVYEDSVLLYDDGTNEAGQAVLAALYQHLKSISAQYPKNIKVTVCRSA